MCEPGPNHGCEFQDVIDQTPQKLHGEDGRSMALYSTSIAVPLRAGVFREAALALLVDRIGEACGNWNETFEPRGSTWRRQGHGPANVLGRGPPPLR